MLIYTRKINFDILKLTWLVKAEYKISKTCIEYELGELRQYIVVILSKGTEYIFDKSRH